ncbi:hypothetical protein PAHAL_2G146000 [Panicum hallii]|uniref:Uncharacterized protein n=1 Tax=Panicum hallii TaxID=206008 RepID=A0A2T8KP47_9POAL|nr:hypothetical protein PAHAL_2G146000 [Panicum hallii]
MLGNNQASTGGGVRHCCCSRHACLLPHPLGATCECIGPHVHTLSERSTASDGAASEELASVEPRRGEQARKRKARVWSRVGVA